MEFQKIRIHIQFEASMTLSSLSVVFAQINDAFQEFYREYSIIPADLCEKSPEIVSVSNGSVITEVIVPIAGAILPAVISIIPELFKAIRNKSKDKDVVIITLTESRNRKKWTYEDNLAICLAVLKEYAIKKRDTNVDEFMKDIQLSKNYGKSSVKMKIQNTKKLLTEKIISNTLKITPLSNCSHDHIQAFEDACNKLNIQKIN